MVSRMIIERPWKIWAHSESMAGDRLDSLSIQMASNYYLKTVLSERVVTSVLNRWQKWCTGRPEKMGISWAA